MKQTPAEAVVDFLSFSERSNGSAPAIGKLTSRQWERVQLWLDDAGLAFYFLQKLKETQSTAAVPPSVLSRLERNLASNQTRVDGMSSRFTEINKRFDNAGVRYLAVKGFSLVPEFCPNAFLRHQSDFDYLVADESLPPAQQVLIDAGYNPLDSHVGTEFIYVTPTGRASRGDGQYSPHTPHAVELHTDIWSNEMHDLQPIPRLFFADQATMRHWNGFPFPAQTDADAFVLQVLHACHHLFTQWIRVSALFEIAYFLNRRGSDTGLWGEVEERVGLNATVREFVVIVAELASRLFVVALPPLIQDWGARMRRQSQVWIEHYGRKWALSELPTYEFSLFPKSKLILLLQEQYRTTSLGVEPRSKHSSPPSHRSRIISALRRKPWLLLSAEWRHRNMLARRSVFYLLARARYVCEIPRWRWLIRKSAPSRSAEYLAPSNNNQ